MNLSEAVKVAGIGGRVKRECWGNDVNLCVWEAGLEWAAKTHRAPFQDLTADDWQVVSRAPREWTMHPHDLEALQCHGGATCHRPGPQIRVREVVE